MKRRTVQKIAPSRPGTFDQQFWPVLVALTVLSGIALGAILTILRGPWMWGSLLGLPLLAVLAIFLLFNLDNSRLRRSLQFAIITSLAMHLLILVFASVVNIFENPYKPNERQVAQRPIRTIEISDQRASFVWEETNARQTPEPTVETERPATPTTNVQPQPIPVIESKPEVDPQLVRRETTSQSVPRQNRELSQLRRQTRNLQPQSSQQMTGKKFAENKTSPASSTQQEIESSKHADAIAHQSAAVRESRSEPEKASAVPESVVQPVARSSSSPSRARPAETHLPSAPQRSPSNAQVTRSTARLPIANKQASVSEKVASATATQPTPDEPSKSADEMTRRPVEDRTNRPALTNRPNVTLSPRAQIAKAVERKTESQTIPSISNPTSFTITPRRSTTESSVATSPVAIEKPDRTPESNTASRELNSRTMSVSRNSEGIAGIGQAKNVDRFTGGMNSPASRASDSARRERTQSTTADTQMLTSSNKSVARRSSGITEIPTSAFKAEISSAAKLSGANTPSERSLESSAATVDAASTSNRDEFSAEKGSATVDLGATKIVTDRRSERKSGGGQPEVSQLNPESTRRSKDRSDRQPSLVASNFADVSAPRNQSAAPPTTSALEASDQSDFAARTGGTAEITLERWSSESAGEIADAGQSNVAQQLADSRRRARQNEDESGWNEADNEDEENKRGTERTRIAQAPITRSNPGFGNSRDGERSMAATDSSEDEPSDSVSAIVSRQTSTAIQGSGIGMTATNVLLQAAASLPIVEAAPSRRPGTTNSRRIEPEQTSRVGIQPVPRGARTTRSSTTPTISQAVATKPANASGRGSGETANLDSQAVSISRSDLEAMEQVQGSKLDVDAIEGPAGLGIRHDTSIGVMTRPASRESEQLQPDPKNRFRNPTFGGAPSINPDAVLAQEAFRNRSPSALAMTSEPTTEAAIHLGLEFLARFQSPDGSWALTGFDRDDPQQLSQLDSDTAATGLALLAFQGAGYNHREFKYARQINHAIQWLIENQAADGGLYVPSNKKSDNACRLYSHGIAALALTEAYGMTQDARLKEPAQNALDYIKKSQDPRKGGWRYFDEPGKTSTDTSVSGWMMMAMQSGRLAGLDVDEALFEGVDDWLEVAADPENISLYRYNPYAVDSKGVSRIQGRKPTAAMTSVGLLMRIYSGWKRDDPRLLAGAEYLLNRQLPSDSSPQLRDTYYWYYATQVLRYVGGPDWEKWNDQLRPLLTRSQEKSGDLSGSWHPYRPVPDRWGAFGGRLYVTTMNLLSLEVRHRMLPLYQQAAPEEPRPQDPVTENEEPLPEQVSTNVKSMVAGVKSESNRIVNGVQVSKASQPPPDTQMTPNPDPKELNLGKPNVSKPTVVKKPAIAIPISDDDTRTLSRTRSTLGKTPLPMRRASLLETDPAMTRASSPPGSRRNASNAKPTPVQVVVPGTAAGSPIEIPVEIQPRIVASERISANPALAMEPVVRPDDELPRITANVPLYKSRVDPPEDMVSDSMKPEAGQRKNVTPRIESRPIVQFVTVSGRVTLDGQVLKNAKVELIPVGRQGETVSARTDQAGRFSIEAGGPTQRRGVTTGQYKVSITTYLESEDENAIDFLETIPPRYNSETTLTTTVGTSQESALNIELSTK